MILFAEAPFETCWMGGLRLMATAEGSQTVASCLDIPVLKRPSSVR